MCFSRQIVLQVLIAVSVFTVATAIGGAKDTNRLLKELLSDYNPAVRPCLDYDQATEVNVKLHLAMVLDLDIKNQVFKYSGFISFVWQDELLTWDPAEYGGVTELILPQKLLWRPDIAVYNAIENDVYLGDEELQVFLRSDGRVRWEPVTNFAVACTVDISRYPFDQNVCVIKVTPWMSDDSKINLTANPDPISMRSFTPNKEYWVSSDGVDIYKLSHHGKTYKYLCFRIKLERRPTYLAITLLMPIMLLAVLSVFSFFLSPEETEKVSLAITILLSFTVFLSVIDNDLPQTSDHISLLVVYIVFLLVFSFLAVAGNALVIIVHRRDMKKNVEGIAAKVEVNNQGELTASLTDKNAHNCSDYNNVEFIPPAPCRSITRKVLGQGTRAFKLNRFFLLLNIFLLILVSVVISVLMFS